MRLSMNQDDPDYMPGLGLFPCVGVSVDGKKIDLVTEVDDVAGYVIAFAKDDNGRPFIDPFDPEQFAMVRIEGVVTINPVAETAAGTWPHFMTREQWAERTKAGTKLRAEKRISANLRF